jgi:peptide/nickel transport system ATP-binding protein
MRVQLSDLVVSHDGHRLVDVPDLILERGRPVSIVGASGSGKSLLAHAIMGTLAANLTASGTLLLDGTAYDIADQRARRRLWGRQLSLLPQEPVLALDPTMRVREQVAEGAAGFRTDRAGARRGAQALLAVLGLGGESRAYPHTLSGGMAQRVAFAAATIGGASVLIADEPSKGLDRRARADLAALLGRHVEGGGVLLTITHDLDLARQLGGDVLVMRDASVVEQGDAAQVLTSPRSDYAQRLLAAEPAGWDRPWMTAGPPEPAAGGALITGRDLAKQFGPKTLFRDLNVNVGPGERIAISGPSGSGKTTLGNILLRLTPPDRGRVEHSDQLGGGRLQKLYQDPALSFPARVRLQDALGDVLRRHRVDPVDLYELLDSLRLSPALLRRRPGQVSGGELQRLAIIRAMLLNPALVFADEPTSRLDLITQEETVDALMTQVARQQSALVLVTHDEALATAMASRRIDLVAEAVTTGS